MNPTQAMERFQRAIFERTGQRIPDGAVRRLFERSLGPGAHVNRPLTTLAVKYANADMVADQVLPVVKVAKKSDTYFKFKPETMFQVAQTQVVGNEGMGGRVAYGLDTAGTYTCTDHVLIDFVSVDDVNNADDPLMPMQESVEITRGFHDLAREVRVAAVVFGASNYGSNTEALAGADRWDQTTSDPVAKIQQRLRTPLVRPNTMVIGPEAWDYLRVHPKLTQYIIARNAADGINTPLMIDPQTVARAFRLERVVIGEAKYNTATEGQTASYSYVWGKSCALIRVEPQPSRRRTQTFGYTMRYAGYEVRSIFAELPGRAGGTYNKVSLSDAEEVVGGDNTGYLLTTVIS